MIEQAKSEFYSQHAASGLVHGAFRHCSGSHQFRQVAGEHVAFKVYVEPRGNGFAGRRLPVHGNSVRDRFPD